MRKESISNNQMQILIFTYGVGSYLLFNIGADLRQDAWIGNVLAVIMDIPIVMMYGKIMSYYPKKNFFDILEIVFGKLLGSILNFMYILYAFLLCSYILNDFSYFIGETALRKTPRVVEIFCIGILSLWILKAGIEVLSSWANFFIRIIIIFMVITWVLLIPKMDIGNLQPIFSNDLMSIFKEGVRLIVFPVNEIIIFINMFNFIDCNKNCKNIFIKPLILSGLVSSLAIIINLMILGGEAYKSFYYPGYESMRRLQIGGKFQRVEIIVSIAFTIIQFLEINYCILGIANGIKKIFNLKNYKNILVPVVFLVLNFTLIMFKSNMISIEFSQKIWLNYGFFMQIVLVFIIFIVVMFKKGIKFKKNI